jgi:hypothetical protein
MLAITFKRPPQPEGIEQQPTLAENFTEPAAPMGYLAPRRGNTAHRPRLKSTKARVPEQCEAPAGAAI